MMKIFKELDLTQEQRATLRANRKVTKMQRKAKRQEMRKARDMEKFITADGFNREAFIQSATQNSKRMIEMRADKFETIIGVLTPEQRLKLIELLKAEK
jgi:Spy/CpxP family protein refolding chaperone